VELDPLVRELAGVLTMDLRTKGSSCAGITPAGPALRESAAAAGLPESDRQRRQIHGRRTAKSDPHRLPGKSNEVEFYVRGHRHRDRSEDLDKVFSSSAAQEPGVQSVSGKGVGLSA